MPLLRHLTAATRMFLLLSLVLGLAYPLALTGAARALPDQADGRLLVVDGRVVGSALLGQAADGPQWFHPRPSASDYSGDTSGGSNLNLSQPDLVAEIAARAEALRAAENGLSSDDAALPGDALTASSSGLDPAISPAYAQLQVGRVAAARGLPVAEVEALVEAHTQPPALGFLGEPTVDVTTLNVALSQRG